MKNYTIEMVYLAYQIEKAEDHLVLQKLALKNIRPEADAKYAVLATAMLQGMEQRLGSLKDRAAALLAAHGM